MSELDGKKCTVDSAFGKVNKAFLIKSSQYYLAASEDTEKDVWNNLRMNIDVTSIRQSVEWRMRALQYLLP